MNVWLTIDNHCPTHINTNLGIVGLECLCRNRSYFRKNFGDALEKIITILWVIWINRKILSLKVINVTAPL